MPALEISSAQRRELRAEAHHLNPVVHIGCDGVTPALRKEADMALNAHGLIKLRAFIDSREDRESAFLGLADALSAAPVQHIGKLFVLWRPKPEKAKELREDRMAGPRVVKLVSFSKSGNHRAIVKKVKVLGNERVTAGGQVKRVRVRSVSKNTKKAAGNRV